MNRPRTRADVWRCALVALAVGVLAWGASGAYGLGGGLAILAACALAASTPPLVWRMWARFGAVALPGGRRLHEDPIPLVGGLAVGLPAFLALIALGLGGATWALYAAVALVMVFGVGLADDLHGVRARTKLLVQAIAALVLVAGGITLERVGAPGVGRGTFPLGVISVPVTLFWVILVTNAFNLIDGMDGQACFLALLALGGCLYLGQDVVLSGLLAAAVLGFLPWNLPTARAFLGDAGSLSLGFLVALLTLRLPAANNLPLAIGLVAFPLFDLGLAVLRRLVRGSPLFAADRSHVHHKLLAIFGQRASPALVSTVLLASVPLAIALWRPGLTSIVVSILFGAIVAVRLVRLGHKTVVGMVRGRHQHQRLYLVHSYVLGSLRLARSGDEVRRSLYRLVEDLPLAGVEIGPVQIMNGGHDDPRCSFERVAVRSGVARWGHVPAEPPEPSSLVIARQSIMCDLLREAEQRLDQLAVV